jgi:hypothetical protein
MVRRPSNWLICAFVLVALGVTGALGAGCDSIYYRTMKRFGLEKRDILVKRVRDARKSQEEAKEEFRTALDRFKAVVDVPGGSLEDKYKTLERELNRSEDRARQVHERIQAVRDVSKDLFNEWQKELDQYSDRRLRAESERQLRDTRHQAESLIALMAQAEARIPPVLNPLRDRVLFLKHNLNARAVGALTSELVSVRGNVDALIADLDRAINEADTFIKSMDNADTTK